MLSSLAAVVRRDKPLLLLVGTYGETLPHVDGKGEGVYAILLDRRSLTPLRGPFDGVAQLLSARNPTWITSWRDETGRLVAYVADERTDEGLLFAACVDEATGELTQLGAPASACGTGTCHVAVAPGGRHVLAANYGSGNVVAYERQPDGSLGKRAACVQLPPKGVQVDTPIGKCELHVRFPRVHAARQEGPHAHQIVFVPRRPAAGVEEAHSVLVPDLGSDTVWAFDYEPDSQPVLSHSAAAAVHGGALDGCGPRQLALHPRHRVAYVAYELTSQIAAFALDPATGQPTGTPLPPGPVCVLDARCSAPDTSLSAAFGDESARASCLALVRQGEGGSPRCSDRDTTVAAICVHPSCSHVFVSSRRVEADGAISAIPIDEAGRLLPPDAPRRIRIASSGGRTPRDFVLVRAAGALVALVANQDSSCLVAIPVGGGGAARVLAEVPTPVCLCLAPEESARQLHDATRAATREHGAARVAAGGGGQAGGGQALLLVALVAAAVAAAAAVSAARAKK